MNITIFHDDHHGTAIIASAEFLNELEVTYRKVEETKVVFSGGGVASIACTDLFLKLGVRAENLTMCDSKGVIYDGRDSGNKYKGKFSRETEMKTLKDALVGTDTFVGVSFDNILEADMITEMAAHPIIFALTNPYPEIIPDLAKATRSDSIIATGRSDFPNQVNNVICFTFIFHGALDVQATTINNNIKLSAVKAIDDLAKKSVPEDVLKVYSNSDGYSFGKDYLILKPVDPRVLIYVSPAVAEEDMESGVARKKVDIEQYKYHIERILRPTRRIVRKLRKDIEKSSISDKLNPKILLIHGYDERFIKAAAQIIYDGDVDITLFGSSSTILSKSESFGLHSFKDNVEIINLLRDELLDKFAE